MEIAKFYYFYLRSNSLIPLCQELLLYLCHLQDSLTQKSDQFFFIVNFLLSWENTHNISLLSFWSLYDLQWCPLSFLILVICVLYFLKQFGQRQINYMNYVSLGPPKSKHQDGICCSKDLLRKCLQKVKAGEGTETSWENLLTTL